MKLDKAPNTKAPHPTSQLNMNRIHYPLHRNNLSNAPHQRVRNIPQATFDYIQICLGSPQKFIHSIHPNIFALSPNQSIPNCCMNSSNLHHLSHPQVYRFSLQKVNALEPPIHVSSLQRTHYNTWKMKVLNPYLSNNIIHYNHSLTLLSYTSTFPSS
jgi:hypothetical protein